MESFQPLDEVILPRNAALWNRWTRATLQSIALSREEHESEQAGASRQFLRTDSDAKYGRSRMAETGKREPHSAWKHRFSVQVRWNSRTPSRGSVVAD